MTRYTFALLVCRVIGILSILTFLDELGRTVPRAGSVFSLSSKSAAPWSLFPLLPVAVAVGLPLAGSIVGLNAQRIAKSSIGTGYWSPIGLSLAVASTGCWIIVDDLCRTQVDRAMLDWRIKVEYGADLSPTLPFGLAYSELWRLASPLAALGVLVAILLTTARKVSEP